MNSHDMDQTIVDLKSLRDELYDSQGNGNKNIELHLKLGRLEETENIIAEILILLHSSNIADNQMMQKRMITQNNTIIDAAIALANKTTHIQSRIDDRIFTLANIKIMIVYGVSIFSILWTMYDIFPTETDAMLARISDIAVSVLSIKKPTE